MVSSMCLLKINPVLTTKNKVMMLIGGICLGYFTRPYVDVFIKIIKKSLKK